MRNGIALLKKHIEMLTEKVNKQVINKYLFIKLFPRMKTVKAF